MGAPHSPLNLPVITESGQHLGVVVDLTIEPDTQAVVSYHVKPSRLVPDMVKSPLIINRNQIIKISDTELVVDDAVNRATGQVPAPQPT